VLFIVIKKESLQYMLKIKICFSALIY